MSTFRGPSGTDPINPIGNPWKALVLARKQHSHQLAAFLRRFADQLDRDGLPTIQNNVPGWGDVVLLTDGNTVTGSDAPGVVYDEPVIYTVDGKIQVLVGPNGVNNCHAVLVLPIPGRTVRVRAEQKP